MDVSIIIPSYRSEKTIGPCLDFMFNQEADVDFEVIVVDSSPDDKVKYEVERFKKVKFIKLNNKTNPGVARNIGALRAKSGLLLFIDSDIILRKDSLRKIWHYYRRGFKVFSGAVEISKHPKPRLLHVVEHCLFFHDFHRGKRMERMANLNSTLLIVDKELFLSNGGFSGMRRLEDTEFTERISKSDKLFFVPAVVGYKIHDSIFSKIVVKMLVNGRSLYDIRYAKGGFFVDFFLFFLLPLIALFKFSRINLRNIYFGEFRNFLAVLLSVPFVYFFGIYWMFGMYSAIFSNKNG
jgi:glycosyltransferase involved in cell wall biosynthesis